MKTKELRLMSEKELEDKLDEINRELMKINGQIATGTTPKSPGHVRVLKKALAKIKTIKNEKETKQA